MQAVAQTRLNHLESKRDGIPKRFTQDGYCQSEIESTSRRRKEAMGRHGMGRGAVKLERYTDMQALKYLHGQSSPILRLGSVYDG